MGVLYWSPSQWVTGIDSFPHRWPILYHQEGILGDGMMAQLHPDPQCPHESTGTAVCTHKPSAGKAEMGGLASRCAEFVNSKLVQ